MPRDSHARVVRALAERGYNADREAVTLLAGAEDTAAAIDRVAEAAPEDVLVLSADRVDAVLGPSAASIGSSTANPSVSPGSPPSDSEDATGRSPDETVGSSQSRAGPRAGDRSSDGVTGSEPAGERMTVSGEFQSTGTGEYEDFLAVFRDRYERLADHLRGRVTHRPAETIREMSGGGDAGLIGMVADIRPTSNGNWLVELEDTTGRFPCLVTDDELAGEVRGLLHDEVIAVEGQLSDDAGILFVDSLYVPDVPRTNSPSTADRPVRAALVSDVHVGSDQFRADAWEAFADWLHTEAAANVEYLLIAGDMVEGIGVYPGQDEELSIVDIYDQYERFNEHLKSVPGDLEIVMIPGNHDAVRLAEPQPAFDERLRTIMRAHDATISANPSTVTIEGVSVLMYHGVSLDELIAELPDDRASYDRPAETMSQLLRKRHLAPQYGGLTRIAPEAEDHMIVDSVPDVFHAGHVHKLGYHRYNGVLSINSSCWQSQTDFQESVNLEPDVGYAPILDLQTLELTVRQFV